MKANHIKHYLVAAIALSLGLPGPASAGGRFVNWHRPWGFGSYQAHWNYNNGTFQRSTTTQFAGGRTLNTSSTRQWTGSGRTTTFNYSTSGGKSGTYTSSVNNSPGNRTRQQQLTTQSGATYTRDVNTTYGDGSLTRTITGTNPSGQSGGRTVKIGN